MDTEQTKGQRKAMDSETHELGSARTRSKENLARGFMLSMACSTGFMQDLSHKRTGGGFCGSSGKGHAIQETRSEGHVRRQ